MTTIKTIFFFLLIAVTAFPLNAAVEDDPLVTIHILSKQVRLLKCGTINQISILLMNDSIISDEISNRSWEGRSILLRVNEGKLLATIDSRPVENSGRLIITSISGRGVCSVNLGSEERTYPLPMIIQCGNNDVRFCIKERLSQYAVDSSMAEYGMDYWKEKEGMLALAHVISARYYYTKKVPQHKDSDFCDLTHCQVYRGRIESNVRLNDVWLINHEKLRHNLFFHSRCGGRTFEPNVFGSKSISPGSLTLGVRDWLYRDGIALCSSKDSPWERSISQDELRQILFPGSDHDKEAPVTVGYDKDLMQVHIKSGAGSASFPVETFRLKINRIKGWNCIRSNSFAVSEKLVDGKKNFIFRGDGLGHGAGLCQHGAMNLSRLGYNRYEILEHYYPDILLSVYDGKDAATPYLSYCIFDIATGKVLSLSHGPHFMRRKVPPGSIFKLIVSLYLAAERPDIFNDYTWHCTGRNRGDANMPDRCWKPKGHGSMNMRDAIPNSCNMYFASLYNIISEKKFRNFFQNFCKNRGINSSMPEISNDRQWANFLAGLDFRISFTVGDFISLARFLYFGNTDDQNKTSHGIIVPYHEKMMIFQGLKDTFIRGTASGQIKHSGAYCNYHMLEKWATRDSTREMPDLWGKTATVIDGTNKPMGYGLFMGGSGTRGIIVVLRKANGYMSARWARRILSQFGAE